MNKKRYLDELSYHGRNILEMYIQGKEKFEISHKLNITHGAINYWLKQVENGKVILDYKDNNGKEK